MSLQMSTTVRNARCDAIESTIGTAPLLKIYSGSVAANCAASAPSGLLCTITLPSDWLTAASSGAKAKSGTWSGTASGTGTAASWRIYDSGDTTCHLQGTLTATGGGGDVTVDNTSIAIGQTVTANTFAITEANS